MDSRSITNPNQGLKKQKHEHSQRHYVETVEYQRQSDLKTSGKLEFYNQQEYSVAENMIKMGDVKSKVC